MLVAQAFHWFDAPKAAAEIHRVLRPGGSLGVLRNAWDESVEWVARVQAVVHSYAGDTPRHDTSPWREQVAATGLFAPWHERSFPHIVLGGVDSLLARVASVSYVAAQDKAERAQALAAVRAIVASDAQTRGESELRMPHVTHVAFCGAIDSASGG